MSVLCRFFRTGYIVPGLGFFPRLFFSFWAISAPVFGSLRTSHAMRKESNPLEPHSVIGSRLGLLILKLLGGYRVCDIFISEFIA